MSKLSESLSMKSAVKMNVGDKFLINGIDKIIEFVDKNTGETRQAVIFDTDKGKYFAPNTIARMIIEDSSCVDDIVGRKVVCSQYKSKKYGNLVTTLNYAD